MQRSTGTIALLIILAACNEAGSYRGDGKLVDHGITAAKWRYVLDLGAVDLGKQIHREYRLSGLPNEEFTVGIRTQATRTPDGKPLSEVKPQAKVKLELISDKSGKVFEISDDLRSWTWSEARDLYIFLYGSGDKHQPSSTYFRPKSGESYRLVLEIVSPDPAASRYDFSLLAVGGGWK